MRNAQGHVLRHNLRALRSTHGIDVKVTFRALPFTPPVKLYLLNGEEALLGVLHAHPHARRSTSSQTLDMYDALGSESAPLLLREAGRPARRRVRGGIPEVVRRPLGNHHDGPDTLLVTPDTTQTEPVAARDRDREDSRELITRARVVLWDFDGPICRLFAGHSAERVATELVEWLEGRGLHGLLTEAERQSLDPHVVLRAVDRRHPGSDLVAELEERLTQEELRAASSAMPTAYADPLIRTWTAVGSRLAIATNNSPRVVRTYLTSRGPGLLLRPAHLRPHPGPPPPQAAPALPQPRPERDGRRPFGRLDDRRRPLGPRGRTPGRRPVPRLRA